MIEYRVVVVLVAILLSIGLVSYINKDDKICIRVAKCLVPVLPLLVILFHEEAVTDYLRRAYNIPSIQQGVDDLNGFAEDENSIEYRDDDPGVASLVPKEDPPSQELIDWVVNSRSDIIYKDNIFLVEFQQRHENEMHWSRYIDARVGDLIEFQVHYCNTSLIEKSDVVVRVSLPNNLVYVEGSAMLFNASNPEGKPYEDPTKDAVNIGKYKLYGDAYLRFKAVVRDEILVEDRTNRLIPWVKVSSNGEALQENTDIYVVK